MFPSARSARHILGFLALGLLTACGGSQAGSAATPPLGTSQAAQAQTKKPLATSAASTNTTIYTGLPGWTVLQPGQSAAIPAVIAAPNPIWAAPQSSPFPTVWISDEADAGTANRPAGTYKYYWNFSVPATVTNPLQAIGTLNVYADNCILQVGLNGTFTTLNTLSSCESNTSPPGNFEAPQAVTLSSFLKNSNVQTNNVFEVDVYNGNDPGTTTGGSPTGLAVSPSAATPSKHAFFSIAYVNNHTVPDRAFVRAATTWENAIKSSSSYAPGDVFINEQVTTASDFVQKWADINQQATQQHLLIEQGAVFAHSSYSLTWSALKIFVSHLRFITTGLELAPGPSDNGTVTQAMIDSLPILPWDASNGELFLYGCNTGVPRNPLQPWIPAQEFATSQKVKTSGEDGFSYFSQSPTDYIEITENAFSAEPVYLGSYEIGWNLIFDSADPLSYSIPTVLPRGSRIPPIIFAP
jgi:hypothetical protein